MRTKKIIAILLCLVMCFSMLTGCGNKEKATSTNTTATPVVTKAGGDKTALDPNIKATLVLATYDKNDVALFDELVPVLVGIRGGEEVRLCHYFLDEAKVRSFLALAES